MSRQEPILEAFEEYLRITKALEPLSVDAYLCDLKQFANEVTKPLTSLDTQDILHFLSRFKNKRTLNRKLSSINAFYHFAHQHHFTQTKHRIPMAKLPKSLPKYLSYQEIITAVESIDQSTLLGLRDYALILFLYASGCRISEALMAQRSDLLNGWLTIRYAKGKKERVVPLAARANEALESYLNAQDLSSSSIWLNYRGEQLSRISAFKIVKKYLGVSPHVLRHSFATSLILGGANLRVVQELLGHASLETTQIYTHIQPQHLADTLTQYHPLG
jgi:integrase/recombinase XerD